MDCRKSQRSVSSAQFSSPPLKILAAHLKRCKKPAGDSASFCLAVTGGEEVAVSLVWMQGRVIEVREERDVCLRLTDNSDTFTVYGADKVPKGKPCLEQGKYVMVMGIVLSCNPEPILHAVKITNLSDNPAHKNMWNFEVDDIHKSIKYTQNLQEFKE
ncbi:recQ-mediated genome instability protein 2 [Pyxicephalus adspersus]|uniref:RecQ-mediated genome instability protein 2 n=1 Tax=Pyxicephalus adspersus TaxID=30357 RepID=A0AAV2ZY32_PYXAD|nr:TPA: hypothetical protein GDO54_016001 [Pyxicephalus adspersus]